MKKSLLAVLLCSSTFAASPAESLENAKEKCIAEVSKRHSIFQVDVKKFLINAAGNLSLEFDLTGKDVESVYTYEATCGKDYTFGKRKQ